MGVYVRARRSHQRRCVLGVGEPVRWRSKPTKLTPPPRAARSRHSCLSAHSNPHMLPLSWGIFLWGRGSTGAWGAAAGICLAHSQENRLTPLLHFFSNLIARYLAYYAKYKEWRVSQNLEKGECCGGGVGTAFGRTRPLYSVASTGSCPPTKATWHSRCARDTLAHRVPQWGYFRYFRRRVCVRAPCGHGCNVPTHKLTKPGKLTRNRYLQSSTAQVFLDEFDEAGRDAAAVQGQRPPQHAHTHNHDIHFTPTSNDRRLINRTFQSQACDHGPRARLRGAERILSRVSTQRWGCI